jgi:hypothetical protein
MTTDKAPSDTPETDQMLILECATWIRRLGAKVKQHDPEMYRKLQIWLHRKGLQGTALRGEAMTTGIPDEEYIALRMRAERAEAELVEMNLVKNLNAGMRYEIERLQSDLQRAIERGFAAGVAAGQERTRADKAERELAALRNQPTPVAWIATNADGDVLHFSRHEGWVVDVVIEEVR